VEIRGLSPDGNNKPSGIDWSRLADRREWKKTGVIWILVVILRPFDCRVIAACIGRAPFQNCKIDFIV